MVRINISTDDIEEYNMVADFELSEEADTYSAIDMYTKVLRLEGYTRESIAKAMYNKALELYPDVVNVDFEKEHING